ncbi:hypothetical protein F2Q68_00000355 [Brassica cretica]|uniref:Uncharacterized protein n=1 Tax=Brassica cretica TaxID=69181 RepID=A0A8S9JI76_BRACR|nr:hypothetical protein F2Q68_00000355 [Brassica cretica]
MDTGSTSLKTLMRRTARVEQKDMWIMEDPYRYVAVGEDDFFYHAVAEGAAFPHLCDDVEVGRAGRFGTKGLAITFVASASDSEVLNQVQDRFEVDIKELPEQIDTSTYMPS